MILSGIAHLEAITDIIYQHVDGLVPDCSISIANALEILQSCTKPLMWEYFKLYLAA